MKKTLLFILIPLFIFLISSCSAHAPKPTPKKTEQDIFESSIVKLKNRLSRAGNEIVEHNLIKAYFDSINDKHIKIDNWIGDIRGIHKNEYYLQNKEYLSVEFDIIKKQGDCEIKYSCLHLINKDSLKSDSIYNNVLTTRNLESIEFSGEFRENNPYPDLYNSMYPSLNVKVSNIWNQKK